MARSRRERQRSTHNPQPTTLNPQPSALSPQPSALSIPSSGLGGWVVIGALMIGLLVYGIWFQTWVTHRPSPALTYTNPLIDRDFPQPAVLAALNDYWAFTSSPDTHLLVMRSPDMVQWSPVGEGLPTPGVWAKPGTVQSPDVVTGPRRGYLLYYTAQSHVDGQWCLSIATSEKPAGPFDDTRETPLVCGATDADAFEDEDGARYLLWQAGSSIRIQSVTRDGLDLAGEAREILSVSQAWEGQRIGAPTLIKRAGRYYLLYSGNIPDSPDYAIGYAVSDSPWGPFTKPTAAPLLKSNATLCAPGGQAVVLDMVAQDWLVYQSQACGQGTPAHRILRLDRLVIEGDRVSITPSSGPQPAPVLRR